MPLCPAPDQFTTQWAFAVTVKALSSVAAQSWNRYVPGRSDFGGSAVKDSTRVPEGWAYYGFGGPMMGGYQKTAAPQPKASCYSCHVEHAKRDNVFMQFYQMLSDAAPQK